VDGDLAVSRALGDFVYKMNSAIPDVEQKVSPEPEFVCVTREPEDEFLILACDGIWDVVTNEQVFFNSL
jgi:serine/threonine protein phosphatase PrpC